MTWPMFMRALPPCVKLDSSHVTHTKISALKSSLSLLNLVSLFLYINELYVVGTVFLAYVLLLKSKKFSTLDNLWHTYSDSANQKS